MKLTYFTYLIVSIALIACNAEPPEPDPVDLEDFMGETGVEEFTEEEVQDTTAELPEGEINIFVNNQLTEFDTLTHAEFHPLDRFSFSDRKKMTFKYKKEVPYGDETMVTPRADFFYYTFADTTTTKNAFYNWMDCFSDECEMIRIGEDFKAIKTPPVFALIYDTLIVVSDYRCEDKAFDWTPFEDSVIARFGKDYEYRFEVGCGGPLKWK